MTPEGKTMAARSSVQGMDVEQYLQDPGIKQRYVTTVFEIVSSSYDRFTCWGSLGLDRIGSGICCGSLNLTFSPGTRCSTWPAVPATWRSPWQDWCRRAKSWASTWPRTCSGWRWVSPKQARSYPVEFRLGDMMALEVQPASVDLVTCGYGLRNCPDFHQALGEIRRVLKPGGLLASLDLYRPANRLWSQLFLAGLLMSCNFFGWLFHGEPVVYGYLPRSIGHFVTGQELSAALRDNGFQVVKERRWLFDAVWMHLARKTD